MAYEGGRCLSKSELVAYVDDTVSDDEETEKIEAHLAGCHSCQMEVANDRAYLSDLTSRPIAS